MRKQFVRQQTSRIGVCFVETNYRYFFLFGDQVIPLPDKRCIYHRVVNGPTRSGPNPARTRKCKAEPENNLKLQMSPKKPEQLFTNFCSI